MKHIWWARVEDKNFEGSSKINVKFLASQIWQARIRMLLLQGKGPKSQLVRKALIEFLGNFGLQMKMQTSYL